MHKIKYINPESVSMYCNLYNVILCSNTDFEILKKNEIWLYICASLLIHYTKNKRINADIYN